MPDWQIALHAWQAFKLLIGLGIAASQAIATTASEPAKLPTAEQCRTVGRGNAGHHLGVFR